MYKFCVVYMYRMLYLDQNMRSYLQNTLNVYLDMKIDMVYRKSVLFFDHAGWRRRGTTRLHSGTLLFFF